MKARPELPPPTADELAAIRARLDGRQYGRLPAWAALTGAVLLVALIVGLLVAEARGLVDLAWVGVLLITMQIGFTVDKAVTTRGTDAAVSARLGGIVDTVPASGVAPRVGVLDRAALSFVAVIAVTIVSFQGHEATRHPSAASIATLAVAVLATVVLTVLVASVVAASPVGSGAVLNAVDGAIARADLRGILGSSVVLVVLVPEPAGPGGHGFDPLVVVALGLGAAALLHLSAWRSGDRHLLADARLRTAEPPRTWLAHPAVPSNRRRPGSPVPPS